jgi:hypothetical protein
MPISVSDSIQLKSALPLDSRSIAKSVSDFGNDYPEGTYTAGQVTYFTDDKELKVYDGTSWNAVALESDIPTKTSQLENDLGYLQDLTNITASRTVSSLNLTVTTRSSKSFTATLIPSSFTYHSYYH